MLAIVVYMLEVGTDSVSMVAWRVITWVWVQLAGHLGGADAWQVRLYT